MTFPTPFQSIRARLGLIIVLAMVALVGYLVYTAFDDRSEEKQRARENLERLAMFAATAERTRFDATENFLNIVTRAQSFRDVAADPNDQEKYDACTRGLFVSDQLVPGTRFSLWDVDGNILCSSRGAKPGEFSAADRLWFHTARERGGFATGDFELLDGTGDPSLTFGIPIRDASNNIIAYASGAVAVTETELFPSGEVLPDSGRVTVVDQNGIVINSTTRQPGERLPLFPESFASIRNYLDSQVAEGNGRMGAGVRITDSDDALVEVIVSAETDELVTPIGETIVRLLTPIALLTLITLIAVWLLGQRWIVRPIEALGRASDALASGDLEARAKVQPGVSELDRLAAKFNEMAASRERASQAKDEFLGLVSHELKTPITTTLGNAEILRNRGDRLDPEMRQVALDDIHESALRLAAIVDNLLVLARLERGIGLESEPLSLLRMAQVSVEQQLRRTPTRHIMVRGDATVLGLGGETYVEQVLQNLIGNAVKYSPPDAPVDVYVEEAGDMAVVRVLDRGAGIDDDELEAVFQPFYRSDRTANDAEGIGIGLSVCKRLVEAMGGSIWGRAREDGGTEFGFSLPCVRDDVPARVPSDERVGVAAGALPE
jgi:signal transduction histidine kinase